MNDLLHVERLGNVLVSEATVISEALLQMDKAGHGILLLTNEKGTLSGVITDGNVRRAILGAQSFDQPCSVIATRNSVTASPAVTPQMALELMDHGRSFALNHLPVIDENGVPAGLIMRRDLVGLMDLPLRAVIMAGGLGTRLRPHTEQVPKPMLPVKGRPMMESLVEQLRDAGVKRVHVATHYKGDMIKDHFGDGSSFGVAVDYVDEESPLGTAGAIGLMGRQEEPLLVMNGDLVTSIDFRSFLDFHREQQAEMTVAVRKFDMEVPFGVVETDGAFVQSIKEKPVTNFLVNAGIYLLEPTVLDVITPGQHLDMTDLVQKLIEQGRSVASFPLVEYWLDVGTLLDYERAQHEVEGLEKNV
jgi:dTDP-glucose pyrophosphorylase/CBS domain-containing protein